MTILASPASSYCQRWTHGRHSFRHPSQGGFDARRFTVVPLSEATARGFVTRHHYSGTYPAARLAYGLLTTDDRLTVDGTMVAGQALVGVAVLSVPMRAQVITNVFDLEPYTEALELGRFVLTDTPANAESWMLSRVFELAAEEGLRGLVSFSDPMPRRREVLDVAPNGTIERRLETVTPGHVGVIYQATNGRACGRSTARTLNYLPAAGLVLPERTLQKIRGQESGADSAERHLVSLGARARRAGQDPSPWLHQALGDLKVVKVRHPGNWRYAWALGTPAQRRRVRFKTRATPYPKPDRDLIPCATSGHTPDSAGTFLGRTQHQKEMS